MNLFKKSYIAAMSVVASVGILSGCEEEETGVAKAVMASASTLTFDAQNPDEQVITVYSDGNWSADVPEWVSIFPSEGSGTTDVTVNVSENMRDGAVDNPRKENLVFHGKTIASRAIVVVHQSGDKYRDVPSVSISDVINAEDEYVVLLSNVQVVALSSKGFVVSDGTDAIYVKSSSAVEVGDNVQIWGEKGTDKNIAVVLADRCETASNTAVTYPSAKDITETLDSYTATKSEYVKVSGVLNGTKVTVDGAEVMSLNIVDAHSSLNLGELSTHNVEVYGYFVGVAAPVVNVIASSIVDNGAAQIKTLAKWYIGDKTHGCNYEETFPANATINSVDGEFGGYIQYVTEDLENTDGNNRFKRDVESGNPRVTGAWTGDYWLFHSDNKVLAGDQVQIVFQARVSGTGHKFWRLEYLDGNVWKVAGKELKTSEPGSEISYTHTMIDPSTNITVNTTVAYTSDTDICEFRFVCAANWQLNGKGALAARNGGTARLAVNDPEDGTIQPQLVMLGGSGGLAANVIFQEDFEWLNDWAIAGNGEPAGRTVETDDLNANAPQLPTPVVDEVSALQALLDKGYTFERWNKANQTTGECIYLQQNYLKVGKTGYHAKVNLPPMKGRNGANNYFMTFDWCPMRQGSGKLDPVNMVVIVTNGSDVKTFTVPTHGWENGHKLEWITAEVNLEGVTIDTNTKITITQIEEELTASTANRWFLDNIKIEVK